MIGVERDLLLRHAHVEPVAIGLHQRHRGFDRRVENRAQRRRRALHGELAAIDARDVEQIVDQPHQQLQLALHRLMRRIGAPGELQRIQRVAERRQRIAQLVGERGEEFVLAPVDLEHSRNGTHVSPKAAARKGRMTAASDAPGVRPRIWIGTTPRATPHGCRKSLDKPTGFPPKASGSMPRGPAPRRLIRGAGPSRRTGPTVSAAPAIP